MKNHVIVKVLLAIFLAIIVGWLTGPDAEIFGVKYVRIFGLIGQLFLNALTLVVVPLVSASIITGTARIGGEQSFGVLGGKTFGFYILTNFLAILTGVCVFLLISPGLGYENAAALIPPKVEGEIANIAAQTQGDTFDKIAQILFRLVPSNILAVASQGQMLGLIFFSILFGYFTTKIEPHASSIILGFWQGIFQIMMRITHLVMRALPIGVFGLMAKVAATTGMEAVKPVALYFLTVILALLIYASGILTSLLFFVARVNPIKHLRAVAPALFTAFSTSSTASTLPITIDCVEKRIGVSNRICSFTIPLATSVNLSGSALFTCVASLFIAQAYGVALPATTIILVVIMALFLSLGVAGIPSASLVSVILILQSVGVPAEGLGLIMAVERILDMSRTTVSVFGNTCCAVLVARSEGEKLTTDISSSNSSSQAAI